MNLIGVDRAAEIYDKGISAFSKVAADILEDLGAFYFSPTEREKVISACKGTLENELTLEFLCNLSTVLERQYKEIEVKRFADMEQEKLIFADKEKYHA